MKKPTKRSIERLLIHELANKISYLRNYVEMNTDAFDEDFVTLVSNLDILTKYLLDLKVLKRRTARGRLVPVAPILENAVSELETFARLKCVDLEIRVQEPCKVKGDPFLIERVIFNLLHNAVKFSPKGSSVLVGCKVGKEYVVVTIENSVNKESILKYSGTGVGLEISRRILTSMGGQLDLELSEDKAMARIYLPVN